MNEINKCDDGEHRGDDCDDDGGKITYYYDKNRKLITLEINNKMDKMLRNPLTNLLVSFYWMDEIDRKILLVFAKLLLDNDADVNNLPRDNYFPLRLAVEENDLEVAEMLLKAGAKPEKNLFDCGHSVLDLAKVRGNEEMWALLNKYK